MSVIRKGLVFGGQLPKLCSEFTAVTGMSKSSRQKDSISGLVALFCLFGTIFLVLTCKSDGNCSANPPQL